MESNSLGRSPAEQILRLTGEEAQTTVLTNQVTSSPSEIGKFRRQVFGAAQRCCRQRCFRRLPFQIEAEDWPTPLDRSRADTKGWVAGELITPTDRTVKRETCACTTSGANPQVSPKPAYHQHHIQQHVVDHGCREASRSFIVVLIRAWRG